MARIYDALMSIHTAALSRLHRDERGQDVIEYTVLAGFIGMILAAALVAFLVEPNVFEDMAGAIANCVNISAEAYVCP